MKNLKRHVIFVLFFVLCITVVSETPITINSNITTVQAATKISINETSASLIKGDTLQLKMKGTSKKVKWSSSSKSIATVDSSGKVTAKKKGTATITAKIGSKKYTCAIKVYSSPNKTYFNENITYKVTYPTDMNYHIALYPFVTYTNNTDYYISTYPRAYTEHGSTQSNYWAADVMKPHSTGYIAFDTSAQGYSKITKIDFFASVYKGNHNDARNYLKSTYTIKEKYVSIKIKNTSNHNIDWAKVLVLYYSNGKYIACSFRDLYNADLTAKKTYTIKDYKPDFRDDNGNKLDVSITSCKVVVTDAIYYD